MLQCSLYLRESQPTNPLQQDYTCALFTSLLLALQEEAKQSEFSATSQLEQLGEVTVGVTRADGHKCAR